MAIPSGRTWAPGEIPTAAQLNTDIRDAVNFFKTPPRVQVRNSTNLSVGLATWVLVAMNAEDTDTDAFHTTGGSNSRLTVPAGCAGYYYWFITTRWENHTDQVGARGVQVRKNSAGSAASGQRIGGDFRHSHHNVLTEDRTYRQGQSCTGLIQLAVADYIEAFVWADEDQVFPIADGTSLYHADPTGAASVRFGMIWSRW
jgi:hypothetical protein